MDAPWEFLNYKNCTRLWRVADRKDFCKFTSFINKNYYFCRTQVLIQPSHHLKRLAFASPFKWRSGGDGVHKFFSKIYSLAIF